MCTKDSELTIEINYENKKIDINIKGQLNLEELIKEAVQKFNIDTKFEKNIFFTYKDKEGDICKLNNIDHIYKISNKVDNSEKYLSSINLEINQNENNTLTNSDNQNKINLEENIDFQKEIDEKEKKIKDLEEIIEKMKKSHLEEMQKLKSDKILENKNENKNNDNKNSNKNEQSKIEKNILEIFYNKFLLETKKLKENIIYEVKDQLKKNISKEINIINTNLKDNANNINNIQSDLTLIKDKINNIEIQNDKKDDINDDNNNNEKNINNLSIGNNCCNMPFMDMNRNKIYICENCKNCYILNECFNIWENKYHKEHKFILQNNEKNINDNDNNINENKNENEDKENKEINNEKENNNIEENKNNDEKKINKEKNKNIKNYNIIEEEEVKDEEKEEEEKEEEKGEDNLDYEEDMKFNEVLNNYFHYKDGKLKLGYPTKQDLDKIKECYYNLLDKNRTIQQIKEYQKNYIQFAIYPEIEKLNNYDKRKVYNNRISIIRQLRIVLNK